MPERGDAKGYVNSGEYFIHGVCEVTHLCCDATSLLHESHLGWALEGPEGVCKGSERAHHGPPFQQGPNMGLVEPRVAGLGAIIPHSAT